VIKKILLALLLVSVQLIAQAQTYKVQNLQVLGTSTFAVRPTFNSNTPYDTGNLTISNYLTTATAASTYAPLVSPTFTVSVTATGLITLPDLATQAANTIVANVTGSTASPTAYTMPSCSAAGSALGYTLGTGVICNTSLAPISAPAFSGTVSTTGLFSGPGTGLTGTAASLSIGGNAATATTATCRLVLEQRASLRLQR
jgi:hypothetical protein